MTQPSPVPTPPVHLTASAVVVAPDGAVVLLLRHPRFGRWGPLGGHVEGAESLLDAVRREVAEESGLADVQVLQPPLGMTQDLVTCGRAEEVPHRDHLFAVVADPGHPLRPEPGAGAGLVRRGRAAGARRPRAGRVGRCGRGGRARSPIVESRT